VGATGKIDRQKGKVKLSQRLIKHHAMETYRGVAL
jgi:hypothetical protein